MAPGCRNQWQHARPHTRPDPERPNCWHVYYAGDVHVGSIGIQPGLPVHADQWRWDVGFCPVDNGGRSRCGYAATFELARTAFEAAWQDYLPRCTEADFAEHRRQNAWTASKYAMHEAGLALPTQTANGRARCFCGSPIDNAGIPQHIRERHMTESQDA